MGKPACQINTMAVCRLVWLNEQDSSIGFNELMPGSFFRKKEGNVWMQMLWMRSR